MCPQLARRHPDQLIAELAADQHGVLSRLQLRAAGLSASQVKHRLRTGRLHPVHRGVYAAGWPVPRGEGRLMAAVLACGQGAVLSHRAAADLWEIRRSAAARIDVSIPSRAGRRPPPTVALHRPEALPTAEATVRRGIPVTTPTRTLLDLAALVDRRSLERAVEQTEALGLFDLDSVQAMLAENPRRAGRSALRGVLDSWAPVPVTRSELEERFLALCAGAGIERPLVNVRVGPFEVDFLWRGQRLIAETDGHARHGTRAAFERDRARDARLAAAGYRVARFTYRQVTREPAFVARVLRSMLAKVGETSP